MQTAYVGSLVTILIFVSQRNSAGPVPQVPQNKVAGLEVGLHEILEVMLSTPKGVTPCPIEASSCCSI